MKQTDQSLLEQMRITEFAISSLKELFSITPSDEVSLKNFKPFAEASVDALVEQFYETQTAIPEVALLIGDSDTLARLKASQKRYIVDLFSGHYDLEYVNNRLRIGLVHKRIGVEPKLYLAAIERLKDLLLDLIDEKISDEVERINVVKALRRFLMFDVSLVFDTYIRSMISEIEISKQRSESYARTLEEKVKERTEQLEILSRTDPLTGLLNQRFLDKLLTQTLRAAQRRKEPVAIAYIDVNDFKVINDTQGHQRGDEILRMVAEELKAVSRLEDNCFRYGGDEFCVVMSNCTLDNANSWKERLQLNIQARGDVPSLSIGIAQTGPEKYVTSDEFIHQADQEMYMVKKSMKNA
jgi:diguanylate cyclase (GGDEF)-like protein